MWLVSLAQPHPVNNIKNSNCNVIFDAYRKERVKKVLKKNPLRNIRVMQRLNPYAAVAKRNAILNEEKQKKARQTLYDQRRGVST